MRPWGFKSFLIRVSTLPAKKKSNWISEVCFETSRTGSAAHQILSDPLLLCHNSAAQRADVSMFKGCSFDACIGSNIPGVVVLGMIDNWTELDVALWWVGLNRPLEQAETTSRLTFSNSRIFSNPSYASSNVGRTHTAGGTLVADSGISWCSCANELAIQMARQSKANREKKLQGWVTWRQDPDRSWWHGGSWWPLFLMFLLPEG